MTDHNTPGGKRAGEFKCVLHKDKLLNLQKIENIHLAPPAEIHKIRVFSKDHRGNCHPLSPPVGSSLKRLIEE